MYSLGKFEYAVPIFCDALVAEKVMGWERGEHKGLRKTVWKLPSGVSRHGLDWVRIEDTPSFSTDIAAAWEVVEKLLAQPGKGFEISVGHMFKRHKDASETKYWECFIEDENERRFIEEADTAPLAIALAALKAVGAL